jgi:hypothetical protein
MCSPNGLRVCVQYVRLWNTTTTYTKHMAAIVVAIAMVTYATMCIKNKKKLELGIHVPFEFKN